MFSLFTVYLARMALREKRQEGILHISALLCFTFLVAAWHWALAERHQSWLEVCFDKGARAEGGKRCFDEQDRHIALELG